MSLTLKEAIQARKLKLIATELEPLARKDRTVKKIVDTLKKGQEPKPDDITSLKGDTQDDVVMAFASVIGPTQTSKFLGEAKTIKVGEDAVGSKQPHYVIVKDRKVIAKGNKEEMMEKCGDGERVWLSTKDVGDMVEEKGPCWDGYKQVGMKKNKKGKEVPNCVPEGKEDPDIGDRKGSQPVKYHSGLAKSTKEKRDAQFKKQAKMDDDNPAAYKPAPGDKEAKTKESEYTKKYKKMFGESTTKTALEKKSEDSGIAYGILKDVYDRGVAAWRTGHRPGTTPAQWGMARVNSFITGGKTRTTADKDLWQKHKGKNEEVDMSDHDLTEAAIKASVVEKEIADMVGKQNVKMKLGHIEFKHKGKMHKIPVDRGYVKGTDYDDFLEMQESVELDEAVRVDDSRYKRSHKEAPKGKGLWGFTTKPMGKPKESEVYMPALSMDYKQAVEMGKKWADRQGSSVVYVLESVSKNTAQGYANRGRSTFKSMHKMVKGLVRADDDMVTNYLDSTHGRHLADAERDVSAMKLKDYIKKDFAKFKKDYDPKLFEAKDKMKDLKKKDDIRKMNQAERIKQKKIMKGYKFANRKPVKEANAEDMMPASPDEKSMALKQAEFIQYVGREIGEHLVANKEFPEWMQNKLSALHQKAKDMHATLGAHGGDEMEESVELDESVTAKIYDAAMFLKRVLGFESKYEERLRLKRAGAKKLEKGDIEGFVKDAEPFLNFIKDGKARYYRGLLNKLKMKARSFNKLEGEDKMFAAMDAVDQMIQIRNYISKNKAQMKESVELEEGQKLFMFDNKKDAQAKAKEIRGKMMELGPKNFAVITKDLTVVREEDELDEMKVRGQEVFDKTFANRTQAENFAEKNGGTVRQVGRVFYVFKEELEMSNYNYRTEAHNPMHVSKAIRIAENMAGNMTGAVEKIEKMSKGLSDHPKVKAALRMANEELELSEKAEAESQAQAIAARIALRHKREGTKPEPGSASAEMMKMSEKDLEDFTKAKKGAPEKVEEEVELNENFRTLARHGMGTEPKGPRTKIGLELDYYDKDGSKRSGKIIKTDAKGYTVKDDRDGKTHSFSFLDRAKAKALLAKHGKGQYNEEMDLMESHFKVGDKVTCIASGMKGEVIKLDEPQVGKYYTVRRDDGKVMKYASDELKKVMKEAMDPVDKDALKKKFKNRKDKDIDNDGDVDSTDKYLHKRRSAISKAIAKEESETKLKEKDVDGDGDSDDLDKSLKNRKQKVLDTD